MCRMETKPKVIDLVASEIRNLKSVKAIFELQAKFSMERNGETQYMDHYFHAKTSHVFEIDDHEEEIEQKFDEFIENTKGEIEVWSVKDQDGFLKKLRLRM